VEGQVKAFPATLEIRPRGPLDATVALPGSKSITNRALLVAALAEGESELEGGLESDDTEAMRGCLAALGVSVTQDGDRWAVRGTGGRLCAPTAPLDARASGTTARFVAAAATLASGPVVIDGSARMRERPIDDLARALEGLGAGVEILGQGGCPPLRLLGGGLDGGEATIDARRSSQYVSAVLHAAPYARRPVTLRLRDGVLVSRPYVDLSLQVMGAFGADCGWLDAARLHVAAPHPYRGRRYRIEPDASAATYPFAAAAIGGGRVRVRGFAPDSIQADLALLAVLERMGCSIRRSATEIEVQGPGAGAHLRGVDVDMNAFPDAALALSVVALFADGPTLIRNVANLRIKETDRLAALETELRKLGARAETGDDWLRIEPAPLHGASIDTYEDHRIAMAFALAGLRVPGVSIRDPGCVAKTWPGYFDAFDSW
jgi:3-phosphoshikimate 1-carboxyvinyltransferase